LSSSHFRVASLSLRRLGPALILLPALIGGCASLPSGPGEPVGQGGFELTGRAAVRFAGDAATVGIAWRHEPRTDDLLITSPLGQGLARISRRNGEVRLVTQDRKEYTASDAESLTEQVLGWRLPLAGLADWVQGRADPTRPARLARDAQQRPSELLQDDWRVEYQEYEGVRPSRLRISRAGLEIRFIVDQWTGPQ
jgi:outer membrane lipoprotein LolB